MPKVVRDSFDHLKMYAFHGIVLTPRSDGQAYGDCIVCGRDDKFTVQVESGLWHCHKCGEGGSPFDFLRRLWKLSADATSDYADLVASRGLLDETPLIHWEIVRSIATGDWLVPGYNNEGEICQLYRYFHSETEDRWLLWPTPSLEGGHRMFGAYDAKKPIIWVCESAWDGLALWEVLSRTKDLGGKLSPTSSMPQSLLSQSCVVSIPTCSVFKPSWAPLFTGKIVNLMCQSDHARPHPRTGRPMPPASYSGMLRVAGILTAGDSPPAEINLLSWGSQGFDPSLKSGYDIRDALSGDLSRRITAFEELVGKIQPYVPDPAEIADIRAKLSGLPCLPCKSYAELVLAWRKAMKWTPDLDRTLAFMLAVATSTKSVGTQLWGRVFGPPASGKTTLAEGLSVCREFIYPKDTLTGVFSGYQSDQDGKVDLSMVRNINGKTFIIKDADTIIQNPARPQILSQFRALFDRAIRTQFKNKMSKDHEGISATVLFCGTSSMRLLNESELGDRFVDCVLMDGIDEELEDEVNWMVLNRSDRTLGLEADGEAVTRQEPNMTHAMQLTGGYVEHLCRNAQELLSQVTSTDEDKRRVMAFGKFAAYMRARPSQRQDEIAQREFSPRLVEQHWRFAKCLAVVFNRSSIDEEVIAHTRRVAIDTAHGITLRIAECLHEAGEDGLEVSRIVSLTHSTEDKTRGMLRFLRKIGVTTFKHVNTGGMSKAVHWTLTPGFERLYVEVIGEG